MVDIITLASQSCSTGKDALSEAVTTTIEPPKPSYISYYNFKRKKQEAKTKLKDFFIIHVFRMLDTPAFYWDLHSVKCDCIAPVMHVINFKLKN